MSIYYGYTPLKFAGPLKEMLRALGLSQTQIEGNQKEAPTDILCGKTPRQAMQTLGTEWGRNMIGGDLWVNAWTNRVASILRNGGRVVVDDCRFPNELDAVLALGGVAVRIHRPDRAQVNQHCSETGLDDVDMRIVFNDADVYTLVERVVDAACE